VRGVAPPRVREGLEGDGEAAALRSSVVRRAAVGVNRYETTEQSHCGGLSGR